MQVEYWLAGDLVARMPATGRKARMSRRARKFDPAALRALRQAPGLTQEQLAQAVGVRRSYAMHWDRSRMRDDAISGARQQPLTGAIF